jgi:hypothetical protein
MLIIGIAVIFVAWVNIGHALGIMRIKRAKTRKPALVVHDSRPTQDTEHTGKS